MAFMALYAFIAISMTIHNDLSYYKNAMFTVVWKYKLLKTCRFFSSSLCFCLSWCCEFIINNCDACKLVVIYRMDVNEIWRFWRFYWISFDRSHTQRSRQVHCTHCVHKMINANAKKTSASFMSSYMYKYTHTRAQYARNTQTCINVGIWFKNV